MSDRGPNQRGTGAGGRPAGASAGPARRGHASGAPPLPGQAGHTGPAEDADDFDLDDDGRDSLIDVPGGVRLQKVLAAAGVGSRRRCEELIGEGRVEVDGETVRRFGARVDPEHQVLRLEGRRIPSPPDLASIPLHNTP
ncbi:MAG: S4 domain-containing protein, partial [Streptosporangiaceae bacterium]